MEITKFFATILLWSLALAIASGKGSFLIGGYNTSSKKEREKIDEKALCKFMAKFLFVLGLIQAIAPITVIMGIGNEEFIRICTSVVFVLVIIVGIIYMNTKDRFKK